MAMRRSILRLTGRCPTWLAAALRLILHCDPLPRQEGARTGDTDVFVARLPALPWEYRLPWGFPPVAVWLRLRCSPSSLPLDGIQTVGGSIYRARYQWEWTA